MFAEMNVSQLKDKAKQRKIAGFAQMNKAQLIEACEKAYSFSVGESSENSEKPVEVSGLKPQDQDLELNDDLQSHPKFAKFNHSGGKKS